MLLTDERDLFEICLHDAPVCLEVYIVHQHFVSACSVTWIFHGQLLVRFPAGALVVLPLRCVQWVWLTVNAVGCYLC